MIGRTFRVRRWAGLAVLSLCTAAMAMAQDGSSPSLGDLARQTRKDHSAPGHIAGKQLLSEEDDGPDSTGVWRLRTCTLPACYELTTTLPKSPKWTSVTDEPRRVLIPMPGYEQDGNHAIRIYAVEGLARGATVDMARRTLLQTWFARPEYFGQGARLVKDEDKSMNSTSVIVTHFNVPSAVKYRGLSVIANAFDANHGFACVFREDDADAASSICEAIIKSAQSQMLLPPPKQPPTPRYRPPQYFPENDPADDPPQDPPGDDDPE